MGFYTTPRLHELRAEYELRLWMRWYRVPAFWLTFIFQLVTHTSNSIYHFLACDLYSQAQTNFTDDLALSSLETAYSGYLRNRKALGSAFDPVRRALEGKLRTYYDYDYYWSRPFEYEQCNPCADHLFTDLSRGWLVEAGRSQRLVPHHQASSRPPAAQG